MKRIWSQIRSKIHENAEAELPPRTNRICNFHDTKENDVTQFFNLWINSFEDLLRFCILES